MGRRELHESCQSKYRMAKYYKILNFTQLLKRISTRRNHRRIRWRNLLSMRTFVCFDFTSEMRRNISARKSRNHFYFFVTKNLAKHFKPIRKRNFFRREFYDDFASWKSAFKKKRKRKELRKISIYFNLYLSI